MYINQKADGSDEFSRIQRVTIDAALRELVTVKSAGPANTAATDARGLLRTMPEAGTLHLTNMGSSSSHNGMFQNFNLNTTPVRPFVVKVGPGVKVYIVENDESLTEIH
jgi:hypothetical protein